MNRGVTLPELIMVLSIGSLLVGIAVPRMSGPLDTLAVEHTAGEIAGAHARARVTAVVESRLALLHVGPDSLVLEVVLDGGPQRRWAMPGPSRFGVAMVGRERTLTFSPIGITTGFSNASWTLTKGSAMRRVVVSRLGRVRIER